MKCTNPECGADNFDDSAFCRLCGNKFLNCSANYIQYNYRYSYIPFDYKFCNESSKARKTPEGKCLCGCQNPPGAKFCNECGRNLSVNPGDADAVKCLRNVAEQGHASAQFLLGFMYANGYCVEQSDAGAVKWFRKAANQGNQDAKKLLTELTK